MQIPKYENKSIQRLPVSLRQVKGTFFASTPIKPVIDECETR